MKKQFYIICALVTAAVVILFSLNATIDKPNKYNNGFDRHILNALKLDKELFLPDGVSNICSVAGDTVYLQSEKPGVVYFTYDFKKIDTLQLTLSGIPKIAHAFFTRIYFPKVSILDVNGRKIIKGDFRTGKFIVVALETPGPATRPAWLNDDEVVVRCVDTVSLDALFYKIDALNGHVTIEKNISERLGDAGFTNDGTLLYDTTLHRLAFVTYYANHISVFDTDLMALNRYSTIDTVSRPRVVPAISRSGIKNVTHKSPPLMINGPTSVNDGIVYVRSYLKGDNEQAFDDNIPIDRYRLTTGAYVGSYYLPYRSREKLEGFIVTDRYLYALFKNKLVRMNINK